ncbi:MAG: ABC transporter permease [Christensenellaceae bacterium]|nr:ABC transporter permease [Christensenellaceae bacterium]
MLKKLGQASLGKLALAIFKIFVIWLLAVFVLGLLMEALPGDVASNKVGKQGSEAVAALRKEMGLDRPFLDRFFFWLGNFFKGDLGKTLLTKKDVGVIIKTPLISSLSITTIVFLGLVFVSIPLSIYCAYYKNALSRLISRMAVLLSSVPEFVLTILAIMLLCMELRLLPVLSIPGPGKTVWENPVSMLMPSLSLWTICTAAMFRYLRVMIETYVNTSYVREAFLAGLNKNKILFIHLLPSALPGIAQILASTIPYLLAGSMVVETLTAYPGMGYTLIQAVQSRETPVVIAIGSFLIAITILCYYLADFLGKKNKNEGGIL